MVMRKVFKMPEQVAKYKLNDIPKELQTKFFSINKTIYLYKDVYFQIINCSTRYNVEYSIMTQHGWFCLRGFTRANSKEFGPIMTGNKEFLITKLIELIDKEQQQ